jgi:hypothetical protein
LDKAKSQIILGYHYTVHAKERKRKNRKTREEGKKGRQTKKIAWRVRVSKKEESQKERYAVASPNEHSKGCSLNKTICFIWSKYR